jgi:hypothetical protein
MTHSEHEVPVTVETAAAATGRIRSLQQLPRSMMPGRDLWPTIEPHLTVSRRQAAAALVREQWLGAALVLLVIAVAALRLLSLDRNTAASRDVTASPSSAVTQLVAPDYARQREAWLRSVNARLAALPPDARQKVLTDLDVIERSIRDVQAALGRDPGNALLRQLLLSTYQDEQHLFDTVQQAGAWTREADSGKGAI